MDTRRVAPQHPLYQKNATGSAPGQVKLDTDGADPVVYSKQTIDARVVISTTTPSGVPAGGIGTLWVQY